MLINPGYCLFLGSAILSKTASACCETIISNISVTRHMVLVAMLISRRKHFLVLNVAVGSKPSGDNFTRFFFIIAGKGCAHPKVFRLPQP